jgi:hypothetical protein
LFFLWVGVMALETVVRLVQQDRWKPDINSIHNLYDKSTCEREGQ